MKHCLKCENKIFSKGLCNYHWRREYQKPIARQLHPIKKVNESTKQIVKRTRINKQSKKQRERNATYSKAKREHFGKVKEAEGYVPCQIRVDGICENVATTWHHPAGRIGYKMLDFDTMVDACLPCHQFIEEHPDWAKEHGFSKSRLKVDNK